MSFVELVFESFPEARDVYYKGGHFSFRPEYEDGFPSPYLNDDKEWVAATMYPGVSVTEGAMDFHLYEATRHTPDGENDEYVLVLSFPVNVENDKHVTEFIGEVSARTWEATRVYLEHCRIMGSDPLLFVSNEGDSREEIERNALSCLAEHLTSVHGDEMARMQGYEGTH